MPERIQVPGVERHSRVTNTNRSDDKKSPGWVAQFLSGAACVLHASWREHLPALWLKPSACRQPIQAIEVILPNAHSLTAWRKQEMAGQSTRNTDPAGLVAFGWQEIVEPGRPRE